MKTVPPLLANLPRCETVWLESVLVGQALAKGTVLAEADRASSGLWLLGDAVTCRLALGLRGANQEFGLDPAGSIACAFAIIGDGRIPWRTKVCRGGSGWMLPAALIPGLRDRAPTLADRIECKAQQEAAQLAREFVLGGRRSATASVAARLLDHFQTLGDDILRTTHREIAGLLHLRRETVTLALQELEGAHAIRSLRGEIRLVDRARLLALSLAH
ncbi:Crp/Fnr family transcriptional regulator [Novosphingobium sp. TH158]|uniref:Crp/Fnr family transcriptional regulator n=1 Tax=Novosphingobium sp. TH158 TaxID=2067455 RepID=UPI000C7B9323|nr:helix-turn-helix domain-containing protein [Novosphingobium sp. TH158]PLK25944.1 hypothetical protein C0V78_02835 [Novosphingobium sp. TH158]